jgi:glycosyltransferase involved in cell wall biosynthesis
MKLLIVIPSLRTGGAERIAALLSRQFAAEHETRIVVFDAANAWFEVGGTLIDLNLPSVLGAGRFFHVFRRAWAVRKQLKSFRPQLVISLSETANFPVAIAAMLSRMWRRTFVSIRAHPGLLSWDTRLVGAVLYRLPVGIVACSAGVADGAFRIYRLGNKRIHTIVNPVEIDDRDVGGQPSSLLFPQVHPYFVAVGRLDCQKGFDVLLNAWRLSQLAATHNLVVLGDGALKGELTSMSKSLGIDGSVHFLGAVRNPFPIVERAEAFVLSSRFEGWPNALAEAMALGVPVISTDCKSGPSELIRSADEGILVPVEDAQALARAMRQLSEDAPLRQRLAAAAKARTAELSPERIAKQWLALADEDGLKRTKDWQKRSE